MLKVTRRADESSCGEIPAGDVQVGHSAVAAGDAMVNGATAKSLAAVFKALSDPTRLRLISALAVREFCVGDLAAALDMEQSAVSHQLGDMREMHLVRFRKEGRHVYYRLDDEHVRDLFALGLAHVSHG